MVGGSGAAVGTTQALVTGAVGTTQGIDRLGITRALLSDRPSGQLFQKSFQSDENGIRFIICFFLYYKGAVLYISKQ